MMKKDFFENEIESKIQQTGNFKDIVSKIEVKQVSSDSRVKRKKRLAWQIPAFSLVGACVLALVVVGITKINFTDSNNQIDPGDQEPGAPMEPDLPEPPSQLDPIKGTILDNGSNRVEIKDIVYNGDFIVHTNYKTEINHSYNFFSIQIVNKDGNDGNYYGTNISKINEVNNVNLDDKGSNYLTWDGDFTFVFSGKGFDINECSHIIIDFGIWIEEAKTSKLQLDSSFIKVEL